MAAARTFVIGDVHGCLDEIESLLDAISPGADDTVVFLGDYIDRGPYSKGVVDRLLRLSGEGPRCVFLKGNHEDMFLGFLGRGGKYGEMFVRNGGAMTLRSYEAESAVPSKVLARVPETHLAFFESLELTFEHEQFLCVHAGLNPVLRLDQQTADDLLWIRDEWLSCRHKFQRTVLFGHTPLRTPMDDRPYKIGLDTGLVYGGALSCLELSELRISQVRRGERNVRQVELDEFRPGYLPPSAKPAPRTS